jgi:hypothetical protein
VLRTGQLERTLTLLTNSEIDIRLVIEEKETTGNKCKRKMSNAGMWRVLQLSVGEVWFQTNPNSV